MCSRARMKEMSRQLAKSGGGGGGERITGSPASSKGGTPGSTPGTGGKKVGVKTFSDKAGMQLGFDLRGSLANITTWIDEGSEEGEEREGGDEMVAKGMERGGDKGIMSKESLVAQVQDVVVGEDDLAGDEGLEEDHIPYERGAANDMTDKELIRLLKQQPKDVPVMRTRESFRRFFARMKRDRMEYVLRAANAGKDNGAADKKVAKRMALMDDCLV
jgi:hypothetical protein